MRNIQDDQRPGQDSNRAHPIKILVVLHSNTPPPVQLNSAGLHL
jgi:hypothetical protein